MEAAMASIALRCRMGDMIVAAERLEFENGILTFPDPVAVPAVEGADAVEGVEELVGARLEVGVVGRELLLDRGAGTEDDAGGDLTAGTNSFTGAAFLTTGTTAGA